MTALEGQSAPHGAPATCIHCGLPVPRGLFDPDAEHQFCCNGCRGAYELIHSCGLDRFYAVRDDADAEPARAVGRDYADFDDDAFRRLYCRRLDERHWATELVLEGVHCAACLWLIERLPRVRPGVVEARLDITRSTVTIVWDDTTVPLSRVARALDTLGYPPHPARSVRARDLRRKENRVALIRVAVAGALAGNVMLLAIALYGGMFGGIEHEHWTLFRWLSTGLGLLALLWPGRVFFAGAIAAARARAWSLDLPIALGLTVGGLAGLVNTVRGAGDIYFDSITMLVFLLLIGRWFQRRQQAAAADSVELLYALTPRRARLVEGDTTREVPIEGVAVGDLLEVRPDEIAPADGTVESGESSVDASMLTGESRPEPIGPGDPIVAGSVNLASTIRVRTTAVGDATRVGKLMRTIEQLSSARPPVLHAEDRIAGWFVTAVLVLAGATLVIWAPRSLSDAATHAMTLLIVTCPCALGLATPLAATVAVGRAARRGILVKGGEVLERLTRPGTVVLDKTGTITEGRFTLARWHGDEACQPLVRALEEHSTHPVGRTLRDALPAGPEPDRVERLPGEGVEGRFGATRVFVGSPAAAAARFGGAPPEIAGALARAQSEALTPVLVAIDGRISALAALGDRVRDDARGAIDGLRARGWSVRIAAGVEPAVVAAVAREVGIDEAEGALTPEGKLALVESLSSRAPVLMVGDGVNDAGSLARATVGVAVHGGAEASLAAADVYLNRAGLGPLVELIDGARRTVRTIHVALGASLVYNAGAASFAMGGLIHPLAAAVLMPLSSATVLALAVRRRSFGGSS